MDWQGLKARLILAGFIGTPKVVPCYKDPCVEFFRNL
jgi:hypothetical protein